MNKGFIIRIPSSCPQIKLCEIYFPKGKNYFETGWMVTQFVPNAFLEKKIIASIAINPPNIQISATIDSTKKPPRIAVLLGKINPEDKKIFEILDFGPKKEAELVIYWNNWKIQNAEWNNKKLRIFDLNHREVNKNATEF